ncbi:ecdysteroid-phosphate phosphatase isoform X2 [Halyomorpha halys]
MSKQICSWNGGHDHFPHLTLGPPFKIPDSKAEEVIVKLKELLNVSDLSFLNHIKLEKYISLNYIGLFLSNESSRFLKNLANNLINILGDEGIEIEKPDKPMHLTLAYKFNAEDFEKLKGLVDKINIDLSCHWKIEMFSRDSLFSSCKVYKVMYPHKPTSPYQLELQEGDYIYIDNEKSIDSSSEIWIEGTSWLSGSTGQIPSKILRRAATTAVWTCYNLSDKKVNHSSISSSSSRVTLASHIDEKKELYGSQESGLVDSKSCIQAGAISIEREIFVMRHGERVDFTFGNWIPFCFDGNGQYIRKDLNMPKHLPNRSGGYQAFSHDTPLTNVGVLQAFLTGEAMKENRTKIHHVFVSPSLRCIETAHNVLCGLEVQTSVKMNIEPGLFEWLSWYPSGVPDWMTDSELIASGFNIEANYEPIIKKDELENTKESIEDFYTRGYRVISQILTKIEETGGNILLVGHSLTLDVCSRLLLGKQPRSSKEIYRILPHIHYCSMLGMAQSKSKNWLIKESGSLSLSHGNNLQFDPAKLGL